MLTSMQREGHTHTRDGPSTGMLFVQAGSTLPVSMRELAPWPHLFSFLSLPDLLLSTLNSPGHDASAVGRLLGNMHLHNLGTQIAMGVGKVLCTSCTHTGTGKSQAITCMSAC